MTQPTALVTGANKGLGLAVARGLANRGFVTWLGARDHARGEAALAALAGAGDVRLVQLDVTDDASVRAAVSAIAAASPALDVLINNAGILVEGDGPASAVALEAVQRTYDVNVLGALRVTQACLPLLRAAPLARIVNVSAGLGSLDLLGDPASGLAAWPVFAYSSSKAALNALTIYLANELPAMKVNSVNPGFVATDLNGHTGVLTVDEGAVTILRAAVLEADGPSGAFLDRDTRLPW